MLEQFILLAQNTGRYNRGLAFFQWGITGVGVGIIILGLGLAFSRTKDPEKQTSPAVRWISLAICALIGSAIIGYAWLGFDSL